MEAIIDRIRQGGTLRDSDATTNTWPPLRTAIQNAAGRCVDEGDAVRMMILLNEVRRGDHMWSLPAGDAV